MATESLFRLHYMKCKAGTRIRSSDMIEFKILKFSDFTFPWQRFDSFSKFGVAARLDGLNSKPFTGQH